MLVVRSGGDDLAGAGEHVQFDDVVEDQTAAKRRRLDAAAGGRAADRDRLELRNHQRRQTVRQRGRHQVLVGAHSADIGGEPVDVDAQHAAAGR